MVMLSNEDARDEEALERGIATSAVAREQSRRSMSACRLGEKSGMSDTLNER
jgi:hypothetical protein